METLKSIKNNFIYNTLNKVFNILFPLITFPYVARILTVDGIGKIDFSMSVIQYFILLSQVGIPIYGIRECAKYRDDKEKLAKTVQEILVVNLIMILVSYILFMVSILSIDKFQDYKSLLILMSFLILTTNIGFEWFYQAIEEYRYITIINIFVKIVTLILVFTMIRTDSDYFIYSLITVLSISLGHIYNFFYINKHIKLFKIHKNYNLKRHMKPIMFLFFMSLSVSIYVNLDSIMLGFMSGDESVGLYVAANKMIKVVLALVTSLGMVLLPRMSYYIENNKINEINLLTRKSIDFTLMVSIPATFGIIMLSKAIIMLFAGEDFLEAIITIRILSPIIVFIAISNLVGIQILVSHGREKITLISTIVGAMVNFSLNIILIPKFHQNGAALGSLIAEVSVTLIQLFFAFSYIRSNINFKNIFIYLIGGILITITCVGIGTFNFGLIINTLLSVFSSVIIYFGYLYLLKNDLLFDFISKMPRKIN
ncbi:flippase [Paenibacillus sp. BR2-3]|uniref:flippase n=1 Tax=Paenibacillus sp. BR2-3 TaxID=3048494 RepID=UPI0039775855